MSERAQWLIWASLSGLAQLLIGWLAAEPPLQLTLSLSLVSIEGLSLAWLLWRHGPPSLPSASLVAMICWLHACWWLMPPHSSEDVWRYLWDGSMWWRGGPTYLAAPSDELYDALVERGPSLAWLRAQIGHAELSTIYPPGAQLLFRLVTSLGASLTLWRLSLLAAQLLSFVALRHMLSTRAKAEGLAALPLICPIWVFDCALGAHLDAWAVALGLWGLAWVVTGRFGRAGLLFGLGASVKLIPALWAFTVGLSCLWRRAWARALLLGAGFCSASLLCLLPLLSELMSARGVTGAEAYREGWLFNEGLFIIYHALGRLFSGLTGLMSARSAALFILALSLILCAALVTRSSARRGLELGQSAVVACSTVTALLIVGSPVIYSWYLGWLIVGLSLRWADLSYRQLVFTWALLAPLTYLPRCSSLAGGPWEISAWWRVVEYLSLGLILAIRTRYTPTQSPQHIL